MSQGGGDHGAIGQQWKRATASVEWLAERRWEPALVSLAATWASGREHARRYVTTLRARFRDRVLELILNATDCSLDLAPEWIGPSVKPVEATATGLRTRYGWRPWAPPVTFSSSSMQRPGRLARRSRCSKSNRYWIVGGKLLSGFGLPKARLELCSRAGRPPFRQSDYQGDDHSTATYDVDFVAGVAANAALVVVRASGWVRRRTKPVFAPADLGFAARQADTGSFTNGVAVSVSSMRSRIGTTRRTPIGCCFGTEMGRNSKGEACRRPLGLERDLWHALARRRRQRCAHERPSVRVLRDAGPRREQFTASGHQFLHGRLVSRFVAHEPASDPTLAFLL